MTERRLIDPYSRAAVRAEVKRARWAKREIDRPRLRRETGLGWHSIDFLISQASQELAAAQVVGAGGGADCKSVGEPTNAGRSAPFAPPKRKHGP